MFQKTKRIKLPWNKWRELTEYVYERDNYCCVFCGNPSSPSGAHVIRRSQQGNDSPNNVVTACLIALDGHSTGCHTLFDTYQIDLPDKTAEMLANEPLFL